MTYILIDKSISKCNKNKTFQYELWGNYDGTEISLLNVTDKEYITNRAHYEGLQWNLAENKIDSPFLLRSDINHLKNAVDLRLGSLCSDKYWGELKPLSPDDVDDIYKLNILYKNEWDRLNADDIVEEVIKNGAILYLLQ